MAPRSDFPTWPKGALRLGARLVIVIGLVLVIHTALMWVSDTAADVGSNTLMIGMLTLLLLGYALLIAVPFVPGIEIGIGLLILQGATIAPFVYMATVIGLVLAFVAGRLVPYAWLHGILRDLHWGKACDLVERLEPMDRVERMAHLTARLPEAARPWLRVGRYALLAGLLNLPGNAVMGGGGGIAFVAGFSRLFTPTYTMATIGLAVLPVPLAVWLSGASVLI